MLHVLLPGASVTRPGRISRGWETDSKTSATQVFLRESAEQPLERDQLSEGLSKGIPDSHRQIQRESDGRAEEL